MMKLRLISMAVCVLMAYSCGQHEHTAYSLNICDEYLTFPIDEDTKIPFYVASFTDKNGNEYLCLQNGLEPEIGIYDIRSKQLIRKMKFPVEGDKAIPGGFAGLYMKDFDHIFLQSLYETRLFMVDSACHIKQVIKFLKTTDTGQMLIPFMPILGQELYFINDSLYIPQTPNMRLGDKIMEQSPVTVLIDTTHRQVTALPLRFPPLIDKSDFGTSRAIGANYQKCFNGKTFVYSFSYSHDLLEFAPDHITPRVVTAKSQYIDELKVPGTKGSNLMEELKLTCETPSYETFLYDPYRKVYYRIAYPRVELEPGADYLELVRSGRKSFSIMVLDENLQLIGETAFPEYTYNARMCMVLKDGLYISTHHPKNPDFSDEQLQFQKVELVKK